MLNWSIILLHMVLPSQDDSSIVSGMFISSIDDILLPFNANAVHHSCRLLFLLQLLRRRQFSQCPKEPNRSQLHWTFQLTCWSPTKRIYVHTRYSSDRCCRLAVSNLRAGGYGLPHGWMALALVISQANRVGASVGITIGPCSLSRIMT